MDREINHSKINMANRRMFSLKIVDSDAFLEMPVSSQLLYFHLSMRADDDGFVANPKKIIRMLGSQDDDFKLLIAKRFVIPFETGVCVIKHWRIHNYIQKDRYQPTVYIEEMGQLAIKRNGSYTDDVSKMYTQDRLELGKVNERVMKPHASISYLKEVPESDLKELTGKFEASTGQIKRKAEQMMNYCVAKGRVYKNYRAFLENGLDKDFGRRLKTAPREAIDLEPLSESQKARVEGIKEQIRGVVMGKKVL